MKKIIKIFRDYFLNNILCYINDRTFLKIAYRIKIGRKLNIDNPITYTEKLQWSKLHYRPELLTVCCDKFQVRGYIKNKIGEEYLIPIIGYFKEFKDIDCGNLPKQCVIKGTHGSGMNALIFNNELEDWNEIEKNFQRWLKFNQFYHSREWQYRNVEPGIIIEEMLVDKDGRVPSDIKIHCFKQVDGTTFNLIQLDSDRFGDHTQNYYDAQWNKLDLSFENNNFKVASDESNMAPPDNLEELLGVANILAEDFPYVRVDLFTIEEKIYFGELTFHHQSGLTKPSGDWDVKLGKLLSYPDEKCRT